MKCKYGLRKDRVGMITIESDIRDGELYILSDEIYRKSYTTTFLRKSNDLYYMNLTGEKDRLYVPNYWVDINRRLQNQVLIIEQPKEES